jgi:GTP-binding protein Era
MFRKTDKAIIIHQDLVVFTKSHQKLVSGSGGRTLQRIQDSATRDLKELFGCDVSLILHVKLNKSKQRRNPEDFD